MSIEQNPRYFTTADCNPFMMQLSQYLYEKINLEILSKIWKPLLVEGGTGQLYDPMIVATFALSCSLFLVFCTLSWL